MVIELAIDLKDDILKRLEGRLAAGESLDEAVLVVHGAITSEGLSERFVKEFGAQAIRDLWRYSNRQARSQAFSIGDRRHDPAIMAEGESLFDAIYKIGDDWIRLGECTKGMCKEAASFFRGQAYGNMREAYMMTQLAAKLRGEQTVRSHFTEDDVRTILEGFKLE
ncbi:MAG TPA: hypothetical protein VMW79_06015 [Anaerolineae bacterium]|nr:hypothetical protein [Anaerolineae bacterium]HUW96012.1 hypothetical protein [Anaerolineae bacterium]